MTDRNGHPDSSSPVMTAGEVAVYLRLCGPDATPDEKQSTIRAVHRLVQKGLVRPLRPGREYVFWRDEIDAYIRRETEAFQRHGKTES